MTEQMNVPKLRFSEFSFQWKKDRIGSQFDIKAGGDIDKENVSEVQNTSYPYPIFANAKKDKGLYGYSDIYKVEPPCITIAGRGVYIGIAHARFERFYPIVRLLTLKPKSGHDVQFHEYTLNNLNIFIESTGVPQLTAPQVSAYRIAYPTLPEQQKIAAFLSKVDEKIGLLSEKKDKLTEYKRGVMQQLFNGKWHEQDGQLTFVPPTLRFKADDGSEFPDWEEKTIENVCSVGTGNKDTQNRIDGGLYPFYVRSNTVERINSFSYDGEAILTSGDGVGVGKNYHYVNGKFDYHQRVYCLNEFKAGNNGKYIFYYFSEHFYRRVMRLSAKNSVDSVRRNMITKMLIPVPTEAEQTKIAHVLSAIDQKLDLANSELEKAKEWKRGLLQQMFV